MTEQSHTPGPWGKLETESSVDLEFPDGRKVSGWQDVGTADGHVVAIVVSKDAETYRDGDGVADANARLIAAAPDLLEALTGLLGNAELARFHMSATEEGMLIGSALFDTIQQSRAAIAKATGAAS